MFPTPLPYPIYFNSRSFFLLFLAARLIRLQYEHEITVAARLTARKARSAMPGALLTVTQSS